MQCQNESIADSPVDLAADLRNQVREQLLAGKSDEEIRNWMAARYGDFILFRPRYSWRNAWLWGAPAALLLLGAVGVLAHPAQAHAAAGVGSRPRRRGPANLMIAFVVLAAALTAGCVLAVAVPLLRRGKSAPAPRSGAGRGRNSGGRRRGVICHLEQLELARRPGGRLSPDDGGPAGPPARGRSEESRRLADARALLRRAAGISPGAAGVRACRPPERGQERRGAVG